MFFLTYPCFGKLGNVRRCHRHSPVTLRLQFITHLLSEMLGEPANQDSQRALGRGSSHLLAEPSGGMLKTPRISWVALS